MCCKFHLNFLFIYDFSEADQDEKKDNQMDVDGDVLIDDGIFFSPILCLCVMNLIIYLFLHRGANTQVY